MLKTNRTPEFLSKFPFGKVPSFESASGIKLFESDAITQFIAESGPASAQLLGSTPADRALIRQWICFADGEVIGPVIQLVKWRVKIAEFDEKIETDNLARLERSLALLERHLDGRKWMVDGEMLSLADITVASALQWGFAMVIDAEMRAKYPATVAWYERVVESEGVKEAFGEKKFVEKREPYRG